MAFCFLLSSSEAETNYLAIKSFGVPELSAANPPAALMEASDGKLYGATLSGGRNRSGTAFRVNKDGGEWGEYGEVYSFPSDGSEGREPKGRLLEGDDGMLYGILSLGGNSNFGVVFRMNKDGTGHQVLRHFGGEIGDGTPFDHRSDRGQ